MTAEREALIDRLRHLNETATPGPWGWRGHDDGSVELCALHSGGPRVVTTAIYPANTWAVREQPYRSDVARVEHPDAELIAELRNALPVLLDLLAETEPQPCESCGRPGEVRLDDGSWWCSPCDAAAERLGYDEDDLA